MSPKKNAETAWSTTSAQPTTGSAARWRNRHATAAVKSAKTRPQSSIEPASADHSPVMEYSTGVNRLLLSAT